MNISDENKLALGFLAFTLVGAGSIIYGALAGHQVALFAGVNTAIISLLGLGILKAQQAFKCFPDNGTEIDSDYEGFSFFRFEYF